MIPVAQVNPPNMSDGENGTNEHPHLPIPKPNLKSGYERCPSIDIEFIDLTYTVPVGRNGM